MVCLVVLELIWGAKTRNRPLGPQVWFSMCSLVQLHQHHVGTQKTCKYLSPAWSFRAKTLENPILWFIKCGPDAAAPSPRS